MCVVRLGWVVAVVAVGYQMPQVSRLSSKVNALQLAEFFAALQVVCMAAYQGHEQVTFVY